MTDSARTIIGVISDTHGLLRPRALDALRGVEHVIHAGDVGSPDVLAELRRIAPVTAVRGNTDRGPWAANLRPHELIELAGLRIYPIHDLDHMALDPAELRLDVVIYGHSHRPAVQRKGSVLYFNPGSAGPKRFKLPITVGILRIASSNQPSAEIIHLPE